MEAMAGFSGHVDRPSVFDLGGRSGAGAFTLGGWGEEVRGVFEVFFKLITFLNTQLSLELRVVGLVLYLPVALPQEGKTFAPSKCFAFESFDKSATPINASDCAWRKR